MTLRTIGTGEYVLIYVCDDNKAYYYKLDPGGASWTLTDIGAVNVASADGGQYNGLLLHTNGTVSYVNTNRGGSEIYEAMAVPLDSTGQAFTGITSILAAYRTWLAIKGGEIYCWGYDMYDIDRDGNNTDDITAPTKLPNPLGKVWVKIDHYTGGEGAAGNEGKLMCLASDGTVWYYSKQQANPVQLTVAGLSFNARSITAVNSSAYVVETTDGKLYAWGYLGNNLGAAILGTTPVDITALWTAAGCVFPSKELVGNYNTLHIIDANDNLFSAGDNVQGEIGNGLQWPLWRTYFDGASNSPFAWDFGHNRLVQPVARLQGKFKNLRTNNSLATYLWAQDMGNNWYSWGRNKGLCLGNGRTLNTVGSATYPNWEDVPAPTLVTPLVTAPFIVGGGTMNDGIMTFNPAVARLPLANAGVNQYITAGSTTLYGYGSSQQEGSIITYVWSKISGPSGESIISKGSVNTSVIGLVSGTYVFGLVVTNSNGVTSSSQVTVVVSGSPRKYYIKHN